MFGEQLADSVTRYSDVTVVSLRFSGVNFDPAYEHAARSAGPIRDAKMGTFWSYVDARDAAVACRLGAWRRRFPDTRSSTSPPPPAVTPNPPSELVRRYLPGTRIKEGYSGHWGGLDVTKAGKVLDFTAAHVWRDYLNPDGAPKIP